ncbi:hypothetical protein H2203_001502 [Taxawa tesnikishii (nom. ined.)]|nr:hypothetical protein H2203_001502 [Dothideales sp. JES 119]
MQSSAVTIAPSPTPESTLQRTGVVTVGSDALTFTMLPSSGIAASGHTIQPGSPAVAVGGVTVSLGSGGTALAVANAQTTSTHAVTPATLLFSTGQVVGSQTVQAASALPTSSSTGASSAGLSVIIDGLSTTVAYAVPPAESLSSAKSTIMIGTSTVVLSQIMSGSAIVIGSQTVQAGGPAATIAGATVSVADDDSSVIVAESLFTATYALALPAQTSPPSENMITIGTSTVSISPLPSGSGVVVGSQTIKPNGSPVVIAGATKLKKRDLCELHGWHQVYEVIGSGGPGQSPVIQTTYGFTLNYQGGVPIGTSSMDPLQQQTIPAGSIGLPNDILWQPAWNLFTFSSCNVIYEGNNVAGSPGGSVPQAGADYEECVVTFPCEGNL